MFPWIILPIGALLLLSTKKSSRASKPKMLSASFDNSELTGIIFNCARIEIVDKNKAFDYLHSQIDSYEEEYKLGSYDDIKMLSLFKYIVKKTNAPFYNAMVARKLTQKQKMIMLLLFTLILDQMTIYADDPELYFSKFNKTELVKVKSFIGVTDKDAGDIEKITDQFEVSFSYP